MPSFLSLLSPTSIMAAVIVALSISNVLFYSLWSNKSDAYDNLQTKMALEHQQAKANADQARLDADRVTKDVSVAWDAAYRNLASRPVRVLPARNCVSDKDAGTASRPDDTSATANLRPDTRWFTAAECEATLNVSLEQVTKYVWFQYWYVEEQEALQ